MGSLQDRQAQEREEARAEMQQIQNLMSLGLADQIDWKRAGSVAKKAGLGKFLDFSKPATPQAQTASPEQEASQGLPPGGPGGPSPQMGTPSPQGGGPQGFGGMMKNIGKGVGKAFGLDFGGVDEQSPGVQMLQQMAPLLAEQGQLDRLKGKAEKKLIEHQMALMSGDPDAMRRDAAMKASNNPEIALQLAQGKSFDEAADAFLNTPQLKLMREELNLRREQMTFDQRLQAETMAVKMQEMFPLADFQDLQAMADATLLGSNEAAMAYRSVIAATPSKYLLEARTEEAKMQLQAKHYAAQEQMALRQYNLEVMKAANDVTGGLVKNWMDLASNPNIDSEQRQDAFEGLADALTRHGALQVPMLDGSTIQLGAEVVAERIQHWYEWGPLPGEYGRTTLRTKKAGPSSEGEGRPTEAGVLDKMTEWLKNNLTSEEREALRSFRYPLGGQWGGPQLSQPNINMQMPPTPGASRMF